MAQNQEQSLLESLETLGSPRRGPTCTVALVMARMSDAECDALTRAIERIRAGEGIGVQLSRVLRNAGYEVGAHSLQRHARGDCRCD